MQGRLFLTAHPRPPGPQPPRALAPEIPSPPGLQPPRSPAPQGPSPPTQHPAKEPFSFQSSQPGGTPPGPPAPPRAGPGNLRRTLQTRHMAAGGCSPLVAQLPKAKSPPKAKESPGGRGDRPAAGAQDPRRGKGASRPSLGPALHPRHRAPLPGSPEAASRAPAFLVNLAE